MRSLLLSLLVLLVIAVAVPSIAAAPSIPQAINEEVVILHGGQSWSMPCDGDAWVTPYGETYATAVCPGEWTYEVQCLADWLEYAWGGNAFTATCRHWVKPTK